MIEEKSAEAETKDKANDKSMIATPATTTGEIMPSVSMYDKLNDPTDAIEKLGTWFTKSGMYGCEKVEQGIVLALHCVSQKKDPLELLRTHHLIQCLQRIVREVAKLNGLRLMIKKQRLILFLKVKQHVFAILLTKHRKQVLCVTIHLGLNNQAQCYGQG